MHSPSPRSRAAFTLIELLTVIAIIGILAAIIIPTVGKVRKTARNVQCLNNLRQWGQAIQLYAVENKGHYIVTAGGSFGDWVHCNASTYGPYIPSTLASNAIAALRSCPLRPDQDSTPINYLINRSGSVSQSGQTLVQIKNAKNPSRFMVVTDAAAPVGSTLSQIASGGYSFNNEAKLTQCLTALFDGDPATARHDGSANAVFADGHTERIRQADLTLNGATWTKL